MTENIYTNNHTFDISVSDQSFQSKTEEYSKITYTRRNVSLSEFVRLIMDGHIFACVCKDFHFNGDYHPSKNFVSTNVVAVDIDDCDCNMRDFMSTLRFSPTVAYETFSNLKPGKGYRFRFLYVFDEPIVDDRTFRLLYDAVCCVNDIDGKYNDKRTRSPYQKIWGTKPDSDVIADGLIYSIDCFSDFMECPEPVTYKKSNRSNKQLVQDSIKFTDKNFEECWNTKNDIDILTEMRHYQTSEQTQIEWNDGELWRNLEETEYYEIKRKWSMRLAFNGGRYKRIPTNRRLMNGEHRRNKIFTSLVRRRLIDNTITFEHLCYAALYELYFFIDNTDHSDYITRHQLEQIAISAYNADLYVYKEKLNENKKFKINKMEANKQGLTARQAVGKANSERISQKREKQFNELSKKYDPDKSVRENAELLGISKTKAYSLKKWMAERKHKENYKYPPLEEEDGKHLLRENNRLLKEILSYVKPAEMKTDFENVSDLLRFFGVRNNNNLKYK